VNRDAKPNIDEYGRGSARTPGGLAIGCAVCTAANIGVRYNKTIPRLSDGTPDMRSLGSIMGSRCRRVNGTQHGLALYTNDHVGKKWATCCIYLQLRAWGIACRHGSFSWSQIVGFARSRKPVAMPGQYGKIPRVATTSYSLTSPARGRSDSYTGGHMIDVWDVASSWSDGSARSFGASDSDFGSSSRPVVPPHSVLGAAAVKSYWSTLGWKIVVVDEPLPSLSAPAPTPPSGTLRVKVTCDTIARRSASISSDKLGSLSEGDVLTVTATSVGGHWSGCGEDGYKWRKFVAVNGKSTTSRWGRAYAYCAAGLTKPI
jgi:hypothetical protein